MRKALRASQPTACVRHGVVGVRVRQDVDIVAEHLAHVQHTGNVVAGVIAQAQLDRLVAAGYIALGLLGERFPGLEAERNAARIGWHAPPAAAEQGVKGHIGRLAPDIPERHVDPRERQCSARPDPVA